MLGDSIGTTMLATSSVGGGSSGGEAAAAPPVSVTGTAHEGIEVGHDGSNSGEEDKSRVVDEGDRSFGGNRWPRQETLALLKIRSDMDSAFRDANVKGPLWEEVSRKLGELGYNRSAKKCKEKFENVYKYHKRTKEGRSGKSEGKTYRFFDQLEAFDHQHHQQPSSAAAAQVVALPPPPPISRPATNQPPPPQPPSVGIAPFTNNNVPSTTTTTTLDPAAAVAAVTVTTTANISQGIFTVPAVTIQQSQSIQVPTNPPQLNIPSFSPDFLSDSTSSSTSSDMEIQGRQRRKRKWKDLFDKLMREVVQKQEEMQKRFIETIEKREHERMVREEAWRMQEMARINREREILAQERSIAATKDAALMSFLQKLSDQQVQVGQIPPNLPPIPILTQTMQPTTPVAAPAPQAPSPAPVPALTSVRTVPGQTLAPPLVMPAANIGMTMEPASRTDSEALKSDNGDQIIVTQSSGPSSSRWPKEEVQALINLRTSLDSKYQDNGPKGPLWEEISAGMRRLGYNRNSKRCKEKWENINKYFKKVKESNKKRPEDSKTCPYFHQLDALYKEKNKMDTLKPENSVPLMVRPEQQWPPPPPPQEQQQQHHQQQQQQQQQQQRHIHAVMEDLESDQDHQDDHDDNDDEEDEVGAYEFVANKPESISTT